MSKETRFKKGEWLINDNPKEYLITGETGFGICETPLHEEVDKYNAHLIKTAPKLYKMLDEISNLAGSDDQTIADDMVMRFDDIEKLLAEARGE